MTTNIRLAEAEFGVRCYWVTYVQGDSDCEPVWTCPTMARTDQEAAELVAGFIFSTFQTPMNWPLTLNVVRDQITSQFHVNRETILVFKAECKYRIGPS